MIPAPAVMTGTHIDTSAICNYYAKRRTIDEIPTVEPVSFGTQLVRSRMCAGTGISSRNCGSGTGEPNVTETGSTPAQTSSS
jgi:hypothetical protein